MPPERRQRRFTSRDQNHRLRPEISIISRACVEAEEKIEAKNYSFYPLNFSILQRRQGGRLFKRDTCEANPIQILTTQKNLLLTLFMEF